MEDKNIITKEQTNFQDEIIFQYTPIKIEMMKMAGIEFIEEK